MEKYVLSLGGSIMNPGEIDKKYVKTFVSLLKKQVKKGKQFFIVVGGGGLARKLQAEAKSLSQVTNNDLDWIGIAATRANAEFLRISFGDLATTEISDTPRKKYTGKKNIIAFGGEKPGQSTDTVATRIAKANKVGLVINLSNIDYVYSADPKKTKRAEKIDELSWEAYLQMFDQKWNPGANYPFDPIAAKLASENKIQAIVANGKNLKNLQNILTGKTYTGTTIRPE